MQNASEFLIGENDNTLCEPSHHILLVEDYPANVLVATSFLESFGYTYEIASNGIEAVQKACEGRFAAILMDVQMQGLNGFEATDKIRAHERETGKPRIPIIGMTAHALAGDSERCIAAGMDDYLSKPFKPLNFQELLYKYTRYRQAPEKK